MSNPLPAPSAPPMPAPTSSTGSLYPTIDTSYLPLPIQQTIIQIPGTILHLIDPKQSIELASGEFSIVRLLQGENQLALFACVGPEVQWPLTLDGASVRLDTSHYFFTLRFPPVDDETGDCMETLNYGLAFASKGQEDLLRKLDSILNSCTNFSLQKVIIKEVSEILDRPIEISPDKILLDGPEKEVLEKKCAAYWTTLAPNVEEYSGSVAKAIASGSGKVIKGILWCGDITAERIKWGNEYFKKRMKSGDKDKELSPETLKRIKRAKRVTKMSEKVATGILSGVVKVSGFVMSSLANSKAGKKIFRLLPEEIILASLDGFGKICDAVEVAGKNVMSTSSTVTTDLVSHKYGDKAAEATNEGLDAAGHAIGTAWAIFKIRKALDPKAVFQPTKLAKSAVKAAASDLKSKKKQSK